MSKFWRTELSRLIAEHQAAGHVVAGGPGLDPQYLNRWFWHVHDKASDEQRAHGRKEFLDEVHQVAIKVRERNTKKYVAGVLARGRQEAEERQMARREQLMDEMRQRWRAEAERKERVRQVLATKLS